MKNKRMKLTAAFIAIAGTYAGITSVLYGIDKQHAELGNPSLKAGEYLGGIFPFAEYTPPGE